MKKLTIEWKHLDVEGETCDRCYDTGENLTNEIKRLNRSLNPKGIEVVLKEVRLEGEDVHHSNELLFNGMPIEEILDIQVADNYCESCSTLLNTETYCRSVVYEGNEYEDIPAKAIRNAVYKVLGLNIEKVKEPEFKINPPCCCKKDGCC